MPILAVDQGTSGTKAIVVDDDGAIIAVAERDVFPKYLSAETVEQDPMELLNSVIDAGREAIAQAGVSVDMVTLANQGETVLAWDRATGEPLTTCMSWQDRRAESVVAELGQHADEIRRRTGLQLDSYFSAPKYMWLRRNLTREGVVTMTDSWIIHRLTGEFVTDTSTASRSLLLNLDSVDWDPWLLDVFELSDEELPRLVSSDEVVGTTTAFGGSIPVGGLIVDQQAALFAEGCLEAGLAKCTYGTVAAVFVNVGETAPRMANGLTTSVAWTLRGTTYYCVDSLVYSAASAVRWLKSLGLIESALELDTVAAADSGGVICSPGFAGLAAPWWRPDVGAVFTGISLSTGREHIVRALLDGITANVADLIDLIASELNITVPQLRVDGGLTQSKVLMQSQADMLQTPIEIFAPGHATAMGAAAMARLALDPTLAVEDAIVPWTPAGAYEPQWTKAESDAYRKRWRATVNANLNEPEA